MPMAFFVVVVLLVGMQVPAAIAANFEGKTIRVIAGTAPGGGHDIHIRAIARHLGRFVPGQPDIVVQNMPGAGGVTAGNYIYKVAKPDGLAIGFFPGGNILLDLIRQSGVDFDSRKLQWIGSASSDVATCFARHDSGVKTISDVVGSAKPLVLGSSGRGTTMSIYPRLLNAVLGTKFEVVEGYLGASQVYLALERGEVSGVCGLFWSSVKTSRPDWVPKGFVRVFLQLGLDTEPELGQVPSVMDLVKEPEDRLFLEAIFAPLRMARPFFVGPDVPSESVHVLRQAFLNTTKDPSFLKEAEKLRLEINPSSGEQVESLIRKAFGSSPRVVKRISELLG